MPFKATLKSTGQTVYVYKLKMGSSGNGNYCDHKDMETEYTKEQLNNLTEIKFEEIPKDYCQRGK